MNPSREHLDRLSADTGFRSATLEKVIRLCDLLDDMGRHPLLSKALVLKGGTALNLGFGPPKRLSVDIDLNYVGVEDRRRALAERPEVERAVEMLARGRDYSVQRSRDEHAGRKLYLGYSNGDGGRDRLEVDLNFLFRVPIVPAESRTMWRLGDRPPLRVATVGVEELVAGKLCALLDRTHPRDLHDSARLPDIAGKAWGTAKLRGVFIAVAGVLSHPLHSYGRERLAAITDRQVAEQLHPTLARSDRPEVRDLVERAWAAVSPFLELSEDERKFTDRLQEGVLLPELLFPHDTDMAAILARHPALLWKAKNAREHRGARRGR